MRQNYGTPFQCTLKHGFHTGLIPRPTSVVWKNRYESWCGVQNYLVLRNYFLEQFWKSSIINVMGVPWRSGECKISCGYILRIHPTILSWMNRVSSRMLLGFFLENGINKTKVKSSVGRCFSLFFPLLIWYIFPSRTTGATYNVVTTILCHSMKFCWWDIRIVLCPNSLLRRL